MDKRVASGKMTDKSQEPPITKNSESGTAKQAVSTKTEANSGTRSSPPRVGGTGSGEAKDVKAKSASRAKVTATKTTSTQTSGGEARTKRASRVLAGK